LGTIRLARSAAMLAARRGDRDRAVTLVAEAEAQSVDPFHRSFLDEAVADVHLMLGEWADSPAIAERALDDDPSRRPVVAGPVVLFDVIARVEPALDARARLEPVDAAATIARLRAAVEAANFDGGTSLDSQAHLAHATAT
jgi:hypothetical protein